MSTATTATDATRSHRHDELAERIRQAARWQPQQLEQLRAEVRQAVVAELSAEMQLGEETQFAEAALAKWRLIHRYVQRTPFADDPALPRSRQWQAVRGRVRQLDDLELLEWVDIKIDSALRHEQRSGAAGQHQAGSTYLVLLNNVAARKRRAQAAVRWVKEAGEKGWITCNTHTLGPALLKLHADSVHSRDNPLYGGHPDRAGRPDPAGS